MVATIINGEFFSSNENGLSMAPGTEIQQLLPKMIDAESIKTLEVTKTSVESAANTMVVAQIVITLVLAVSLKSMWNLMNVI